MSPIERFDPDTGRLVYRSSHALTPWVSASFMVAFGALAYGYSGGPGGGRDTAPTPSTATATAVYFFTNWSTGAGTTPYYQADSASATPWPDIKGTLGTTARDGWVVVDTAAALGFPTGVSHVGIAKNMASGSPAVGVRSDTTGAGAGALDTMLVGESNFYGVFFKNTTPDSYITGGGDAETHPLQARASTTATLPWEWMVLSNSDGTWEFDFYLVAHTNYPGTSGTSRRFELATSRTNNIQLSKDTVYYFGWEVRRTHVDSVEYHVEVGVVINADSIDWRWDDNDFISLGTAWPSPFPNANSTTLADSPRWVYQDAPPGAYRGVNLGSNGWSVDPATDQDSYIFGAFCIRKDQHCHGYTGN